MDQPSTPKVTRRGMLLAGGAILAGSAGGYVIGRQTGAGDAVSTASPAPSIVEAMASNPTSGEAATPAATTATRQAGVSVPFYGAHQAGIDTPPPAHACFIGLDMRDSGRASAEAILRIVSDDAARLTQGIPALADTEPELATMPAGLTITIGLGLPFFDRAGIQAKRPAAFVPIPKMSTDAFESGWEQTDLLLQVCTDDPTVLAHVTRMLTKDLGTLTQVAWMQHGFRTPAEFATGTARNLMGQVDGTVNPAADQFDEVVWMSSADSATAGGSVLVLRRIRLLLDTWDALDRDAKEIVIGRRLNDGAPLGATGEFDPVPFDAVDDLGLPVIASDAHIRVAHAATTGEMILRRPFNYDAGMHKGTNDMGLIFAAYMADPRRSFIPMQERIAASDAFNRWNRTIGSATYFIPPGCQEGGFVGEGVLI